MTVGNLKWFCYFYPWISYGVTLGGGSKYIWLIFFPEKKKGKLYVSVKYVCLTHKFSCSRLWNLSLRNYWMQSNPFMKRWIIFVGGMEAFTSINPSLRIVPVDQQVVESALAWLFINTMDFSTLSSLVSLILFFKMLLLHESCCQFTCACESG